MDEYTRSGKIPPLKAYIGLYSAIEALGRVEMECEHPQHVGDPWERHEGPGIWYMTGACEACGQSDNGVALVCDKFKEAVDMGKVLMVCGTCDSSTNAKNYLTVLGRR